METKLNIAEILKYKPENTKLYSLLFGDMYLSYVKNGIINVEHHGKKTRFFDNGRYYNYPGSEPLLFPSKEMHDWSKFAWKKGDVLVSEDNVHIIFEYFENDDYTRFKGKHYFWKEGNEEDYSKEETKMLTSVFEKASDDKAQTYINTIEERLGGKLNLETLEIEQSKQYFKDGDIVFMKGIEAKCFANCIFILRGKYKDGEEKAFYYAFYNADDKFAEARYGNIKVHYSLRPATDSEKQQLFKALAKENKAWDAEKKQIVDLKPKVELKPFDKVLVRDSKSDYWRANLFSHIDKNGCYYCVWASWTYCIPYNEKTKHLLNTTDKREESKG